MPANGPMGHRRRRRRRRRIIIIIIIIIQASGVNPSFLHPSGILRSLDWYSSLLTTNKPRRIICYQPKISRDVALIKSHILELLCYPSSSMHSAFLVNIRMFKNVFRKLCLFFETVWKNVVEQQMTIWRMRVTFWIPKAANIRAEYVIIITFPLKTRLHERALTLRYTYIVCLVLFIWS
jgi:hypothetical protein